MSPRLIGPRVRAVLAAYAVAAASLGFSAVVCLIVAEFGVAWALAFGLGFPAVVVGALAAYLDHRDGQ